MGGKVRERSNKVHRFSIIHLSILLWKTDCVCVCVCEERERERIVCLLAYIPCRQLVTSGTFWAIVLIRQRGSVGWKVMVFCGSKGQTWRIVFRSCIYSCYVKPGMNVERERVLLILILHRCVGWKITVFYGRKGQTRPTAFVHFMLNQCREREIIVVTCIPCSRLVTCTWTWNFM